MKLRVYLDTSVFSAYYDEKLPDRMMATREFWARLSEFEISTSELSEEELSNAPEKDLRNKFEILIKDAKIHKITNEMVILARQYISKGIFSPAMFNDALHVSAAVLTRQDVLLSWNFRHLVNRRRRSQVNEVDISLGLPAIDIVAPPEI